MPWKGEKDPYKIWLSEIILQQTRVEQGLKYYSNFIHAFPDINHLANAPERKVFKLWEGLGYYTRCRNLISTAKYISNDLKGKFPDTYEEISSLKGIGPYTAAAISSFAFDLPFPVVDGNVFRVLSRVFGVTMAIDTTQGKKYFSGLAGDLLDQNQPGLYNQAIMDFGATVCKPVSPQCNQCIFQDQCFAYLHNMTDVLPIKEKKIKIRKRWFYYMVFEYQNTVAIRQRTKKDIWQELYDFPLIETSSSISQKDLLKKAKKDKWISTKGCQLISVSPVYNQQLSHQLITGYFLQFRLNEKPQWGEEYKWVGKNNIRHYAFPRLINSYLKDMKSK